MMPQPDQVRPQGVQTQAARLGQIFARLPLRALLAVQEGAVPRFHVFARNAFGVRFSWFMRRRGGALRGAARGRGIFGE